jgi:hypothetical protein
MRWAVTLVLVVASGLLAGGCGSSRETTLAAGAASSKAPPKACPSAWRPGWKRLADDIGASVFCPSWMPDPLVGEIGGPWFNGRSINARKEYLVSFAWLESGGASGVMEVHVNFRGYPGRAAIPVCEDTLTVNGKTVHPKLPCFSDARGRKRIGDKTVTVYTANQGADLWHVLYAWHDRGSLYTLSEHVAPPYTYAQVVANLDRMTRGLVRVSPSSS